MVQQQATTEPLDVQAVVPLPEAIHLPISSVEEMETVDDLLRDINIFNAMVSNIQCIQIFSLSIKCNYFILR